jgi:predicted small metal-binding protein
MESQFCQNERFDMQTSVRKVIDCREFPSETNCTLTIAGTETEVLKAASEHAVSSHGHKPGPELEQALRSAIRDET